MGKTSAGNWQRSLASNTPGDGDAAGAPLWKQLGYVKYYLFLLACAAAALNDWVRSRRGPPKDGEQPYVALPSGTLTLFLLAISYSFLKKAADITSLRGNAPGLDGKHYYDFLQCPDHLDGSLRSLGQQLRNGTWLPGPLRQVTIQMGAKSRVLNIPNLFDRIVERAIVLALTPIYEALFHPCSFGFRPGRSCAEALRKLTDLCRDNNRYVLGKVDLKDAFDRIPHNRLLDIVRRWIKDKRLVRLIELIVKRTGWSNKKGKANIGLPQGGPLSPLLFNIYIDHVFDQVVRRHHPDIHFIRWADDIILICRDKEQLHQHRQLLNQLFVSAGLEINEKKTYADDASASLQQNEAIEFLGYNVVWNGSDIGFSLTEDAWLRLHQQLYVDVTHQRPNVGWNGLKNFLNRQCNLTIGSWLSAYAGAIQPGEWPEVKGQLKAMFWTKDDNHSLLRIDCPSNRVLNDLYEHARRGFDQRFNHSSSMETQRHCSAMTIAKIGTYAPDLIADGADLVPAPLVFIEPYGDRKPSYEEVEWRVRTIHTQGDENGN